MSARPVIAFGLLAVAGPALCDEETAPVPVESIVVTAQKRSERLQDVPLSASVIEAQTLLERNTPSARDYLTRVPGVAINEVGSGQTQLAIRGIATGYGGNPLVGITIDDVPFGSSLFASLGCCIVPELDPWLLDRVEVLRGPQGTLYGANAMGGLVKFMTATSGFGRRAARAEVDGSTVAHGNQGYGIRAAFAAPLMEDRFALQASAFHRQDPGYTRDFLQGRENVNEARVSGGQVALAGRITPDLSMRLASLYQEKSTDGSNMVDIDLSGTPLYGPYEHRRMPGTDGLDTHLQFHTLALTADLGAVSLTSLTGYQRHHFSNPTDLTPSYRPLLPIFYPGATGLGLGFLNTIQTDRWTQELRVASRAEARLRYVAGLFYSDEKNRIDELLYPATYATGEPRSQLRAFYDAGIDERYKQRAVFGEATWMLDERFDLSAGGRYSHNQVSIFQTRAGIIASTPTRSGSSSDNPTTYSVASRYRFDTDRMLYARIASGYRTGGPNFNFPPGHQSFEPDKTTNYELGVKGTWLDRRLSIDAAVYAIDWRKIQVLQVTPTGLAYFTNAGKASSKGVEMALDYQPVRGLRVAASAAYDNAKLEEDAPPGTFVGKSGDRLPFTAKWTASASIDYSRPIAAGTSVFAGVTAAYTGQRLIDFSGVANVPRLPLPSFTTIDLRFGLRMERLSATLFVKNAGDKRGYLGGQNFTAGTTDDPNGPWTAALNAPRTVGIALAWDL